MPGALSNCLFLRDPSKSFTGEPPRVAPAAEDKLSASQDAYCVAGVFGQREPHTAIALLAKEVTRRTSLQLPVLPRVETFAGQSGLMGAAIGDLEVRMRETFSRPRRLALRAFSLIGVIAGLYLPSRKSFCVSEGTYKSLRGDSDGAVDAAAVVAHELTHAAQDATYPDWFADIDAMARQVKVAGKKADKDLESRVLRRMAWTEGHASVVEKDVRRDCKQLANVMPRWAYAIAFIVLSPILVPLLALEWVARALAWLCVPALSARAAMYRSGERAVRGVIETDGGKSNLVDAVYRNPELAEILMKGFERRNFRPNMKEFHAAVAKVSPTRQADALVKPVAAAHTAAAA